MTSAAPQGIVDGRWWEDRWWEAANQPWSAAERQQIADAVDFLREYFPATWVKARLDADDFHPIIRYLCWERGIRARGFLVTTARMIRTLQNVPGFKRKFAEFKGDKHSSVSLELEIASLLVEENLATEFPPEGTGKTPDLVVRSGGEPIAIECKRLQRDARDDWRSYFMGRISQAMPHTARDTEVVVQMQLDEALADLLFGQENADLNRAILDDLAQRIQESVQKAIASAQQFPIPFAIRTIATGAVLKKDPGVYGSVGIPISLAAKFRRVLSRGLFEAMEQLADWPASIAIIYTDLLPDPELARIVFDAITRTKPELYDKLIALIILPTQYMLAPYIKPLALPAKGHHEAAKFRPYEILTRRLQAHVQT